MVNNNVHNVIEKPVESPIGLSLQENEYLTFDMYFGTIAGMAFHPGWQKNPEGIPTIEQCASIALNMIMLRRTLIPLDS